MRTRALTLVTSLLLVWGCGGTPDPAPEDPPPARVLPERHVRWPLEVGQGGTPDPAHYADLVAEGYAALLCVDGPAPDAAAAEAAGLARYHVPLAYGPLSEYQRLAILRAAQAAPGPLYVYGRRGLHRAAAATALVRLDRGAARADVLEGFLETVDPQLAGLIASVRDFAPPSLAEVESVGIPPARVMQKSLGMLMDDVDEHYAALEKAPGPELAALLRLDLEESARVASSDAVALDLRAASAEAGAMEALLAEGPPDGSLQDRIAAFAERCVHCHATYR